MSKIVFLAVAAALVGAGNGLAAFANGEALPEAPNTPTGDDGGSAPGAGEAPKRGRGRPPGGTAAAAPAAPTEAPKTGPTDEERFEKNRALIKPLVDGGQGEDVKKVTAKYSTTGIKGIPADKQAEFEKDIEALTY